MDLENVPPSKTLCSSGLALTGLLTSDKRELKDFRKLPSATSFIRKMISKIRATTVKHTPHLIYSSNRPTSSPRMPPNLFGGGVVGTGYDRKIRSSTKSLPEAPKMIPAHITTKCSTSARMPAGTR
jgi:hypothetical protein